MVPDTFIPFLYPLLRVLIENESMKTVKIVFLLIAGCGVIGFICLVISFSQSREYEDVVLMSLTRELGTSVKVCRMRGVGNARLVRYISLPERSYTEAQCRSMALAFIELPDLHAVQGLTDESNRRMLRGLGVSDKIMFSRDIGGYPPLAWQVVPLDQGRSGRVARPNDSAPAEEE